MSIRLANTTATPVELHLSADVVIVSAEDSIVVSDDDAALGQVMALCRQGILVVQELPEDRPPTRSSTPRSRARPTSGRRGKK